MIHIVLLSGGSGTRLWPLSNNARSKQFLKVLRDENGNSESMVQRTFRKIAESVPNAEITIATCESQVYSIQSQIQSEYSIVVEPERRDTAPAIMLASAYLAYERHCCPDDTIVVMPIDSYTDDNYYEKINELDSAVKSEKADIVLLGVKPTFPSTKYGYILPESTVDNVCRVKQFTEKPENILASDLVSKGALWNCGVFGFKLSYLLNVLNKYTKLKDYASIKNNYQEFPKNSFDYEVVEQADSIAVIPCAIQWKDLGTWNTLSEEMAEPIAGRAVVDEDTCNNVHVINETGLPLVVAGLNDSVVIATPDGILVSSKYQSAYIKSQVAEAAATRPMYEQRQWGEYRVIDTGTYPDGSKVLTKELHIKSGKQLSYQSHECRNEVWTIVSGSCVVVLDGEEKKVSIGDVVRISKGVKHSLMANDDTYIIEVQIGDSLIEEDIQRFGYYWN